MCYSLYCASLFCVQPRREKGRHEQFYFQTTIYAHFTDNAEEFQEEFKSQPAMFERLEGRQYILCTS